MTKLFACFALFCLIGTAFSAKGDACVDNSLLTLYGFKATAEATEIEGTALDYCKSLMGGTSCCGTAIVNKFQDDIEDLAKTWVDAVIKRDTAIVTLRDTTIPALGKKLATLQTNAADALVTIKKAITREDEPTVKPYELDEAEELATNLEDLAEAAIDNLSDATKGFTAFQKARSSCVVELLGLQAAAWCLACDPTALAQGVGDAGEIAIAEATCTRLKGACYDYVTASVTQSSILDVAWINTIVDDLNTALVAVAAAADEDSLQLLSSAVEPAEDEGPEDEAMAVELPTGCTSEADCDWICDDLFFEGEVEGLLLVQGGTPTETPLVETTPAALVVDDSGRRLAGSWAPDADEAGVTIDWQDDPAEVNSDDTVTPAGAGIIKSGFVCVIALLSVFFF